MQKPNKYKHILVLRLAAMGDVAMTVPVIEQLHAEYPDLRITVVTRPFYGTLFKDTQGVELFLPDFKGRHKGIKGIWRMHRDLMGLGVDCVADQHNVLRTIIMRTLLWLSGKPVVVINKSKWDKKLMTRKFRKVKKQLDTTIVRYTTTFRRLGFRITPPTPPAQIRRPLSPEVRAIVGEKGTDRWIGFSPFAQHLTKIYPLPLSAELIDLLVARGNRVFLFGGGKHEAEFTQAMATRNPGRVVSMIGVVSFAEEIDLMSNMDCAITMDSSALHISSILGVRAVSIWGATHPFLGFYGFGQSHDDAIQLDLPCRPCSVYGNKPCVFADCRCLAGISPHIIAEKVGKL